MQEDNTTMLRIIQLHPTQPGLELNYKESEALAVHNGWSGLIVLALGDLHLQEDPSNWGGWKVDACNIGLAT